MPTPIGPRLPNVRESVTNAVETVANSTAVQSVGDAATYVAEKVDQFDTAAAAAARAARTRAGARVVGAVSGAIVERLRPGSFEAAGNALLSGAQRMGLSPGVLQGAQNVAGAALHGAGIAAIGYDAVRSFTDTKADFGSRTAQAGAALAVGAATFIPGVGTGIVIADVVTGGGVTGGVKGLVALGDAALTGDRDALNSWGEQARNGDMGWLIKAAANNETVANATGRAAEAVISGVSNARQAVGTAARATTRAVSNAAATVSNVASNAHRAVTNAIANPRQAATAVANTARNVVNNTTAAVTNAAANARSAVSSAFSSGWRALTSW